MKLYLQAGFSFIVRLQGPRNSFQRAGAGDHLCWSGGGGGMVGGGGGGGGGAGPKGRGKFGCSLFLAV